MHYSVRTSIRPREEDKMDERCQDRQGDTADPVVRQVRVSLSGAVPRGAGREESAAILFCTRGPLKRMSAEMPCPLRTFSAAPRP